MAKSKEQVVREALKDIETFWENSNIDLSRRNLYRALYVEQLLNAVLEYSKSDLLMRISRIVDKARASFKVELTRSEEVFPERNELSSLKEVV